MNQEEKTAPRLERLRPKDTRDIASRSAAYSRLVARLRWILPALVLTGLAALMLWPRLDGGGIAGPVVQSMPDLMVQNLRLTGLDKKNQAYSLTAARALQATADGQKGAVDLEKPEAEMALTGGAWLAGRAQKGRLDQSKKALWLGGAVEFFHDAGNRLTSDEVFIDINQETAWGEKPVLIQGPFGEIRGQGFRLLDGGRIFVVKGYATARLDLRALQGDKPSGKDSPSR